MTHSSFSRPALHTSLFYCAIFAAMGAHVPFWPVWLEDWGLSTAEVGVYTSIGVVVRVVAGIGFPVLADRLDRRRATLVTLSLIAALLFVAHLFIDAKWPLLIATAGAGAMIAGIMPLGEALGMAASRKHGFAYAHARSAGSLSFLLTAISIGYLVSWFGINVVLYCIVAGLLGAAFFGARHPGGGAVNKQPPALGEIAQLILNPTFALFALCTGLLQASHAVYFAYGSIHWRDLGLDEDKIGALWSFAIAAEIAMMMGPGPWLVRRLGAVGAMLAAGLVAALRWAIMSTDPTGSLLWVLQLTHAATFGLGHLGAIAFIAAAVPERMNASAQGAYSGLAVGLLMALGMWISSRIYTETAGQTYYLGTVMAGLGVLACIVLARRWGGKLLSV